MHITTFTTGELISAVRESNFPQVRELLRRNTSPHIRDNSNETALKIATKLRKVNIAQILVDYGADPLLATNNESALDIARGNGDLELVSFFLRKCANAGDVVFDERTKFINRALISSSFHGECDMIAVLLEQEGDPNFVDEVGNTPLTQAVMHGRLFVVRLLLEKGALPDFIPPQQDSFRLPLHWAVQENYLKIAQLLIDYGANVNAEDIPTITPLGAATFGGFLEMMKLLIDAGADINGSNNTQIPLVNAVASEELDAVKLLLSYGADVNKEDSDGDSALSYAVSNGMKEIIGILEGESE